MPNLVYLDSSGLIAAIRRKDGLHRQARLVLEDLAEERAKLITSEWVLAEFLAGAARRPLRTAAVAVIDTMRSGGVEIVASGSRSFAAALDLYRSRTDKDWSLIDCASILTCQGRGIRQVFSHDHHFKQAGLEVLLK